jgi:nitrogen fixation/metabolism regulation signal transduction histidine kinase
MYSLVSDANGVPFAVVYLPYQDIKTLQKQDLWEFFDLLVEIYLLIFIGAAELAFLLSKYISRSLETVSEGLKKVRLNQKNEPIEWASNDEIGALVTEYNHMVQELETSAIKLARSERDTAWKEMARLVAHEIKNPLTPMRLQVQHLQKSLPTTAPEKLQTFSASMLDQIDTLANIADSFSRFANLPTQQLAYLNMQELVERAVALHPNLDIKTELASSSECVVLADKDQLVRVLNNLITNAQQAIPEDRKPEIKMRLWCDAQSVYLSITDNGTGIPEDQMDRIFEPSFTTKTKGMGLGLAIVRNILEGVHGQISVSSNLGSGTTFFITLPRKYFQ